MTDRSKAIWQKLFKPLLITTVIAVVTYSVLIIYGDIEKIKTSLCLFNYHLMLIALLLAGANYMLRFIKWNFYLKSLNINLPVFESLLTFLSGLTVSITPAKVGEFIKSLLMKETRNIPIAKTAPIVVAERLTDLIAILILSLIGSFSYRYGFIFLIVSSIFVLLIIVIITLRNYVEKFILKLSFISFIRKIQPKILESYRSTYLLAKWDRLLFPTILSIAAWLAECVAFFIIANGFNTGKIDILPSIFIYSFSTAAGALAMMPGGIGVTEGGLTGLLQLFKNGNYSPAVATSITILTRGATLWFAVIVGAISLSLYMKLSMKKRKTLTTEN